MVFSLIKSIFYSMRFMPALLQISILLLSSCSLLLTERPEIPGVANIYLTMSDEGVQFLKESDTYDSDYTHCYIELDKGAEHAWIKARGFSSRQSYKRSFTVKMTDLYGGENKYAFNAAYPDASCIRNRLAFAAYRDLEIPAPEVQAAALFLNSEYIGYYDMVAIYDGESLKDFYGVENFELYKSHFCEFEGNNAFGEEHPLQSLTEKKFPDNDDYESLNRMIISFLELDDNDWNLWVEHNFLVEETARYCAIHTLLKVGETSTFNFYIAVVDGKYTLLPWDNENCLNNNNISTGLSRLQSRLLIEGSPVKTRYDEIMAGLVDETSSYSVVFDNLITRVPLYMDQIDRAVYHDNHRNFNYADFLEQERYLIDYINNRIIFIESHF